MNQAIIRDIHRYVARYSVTPSAARGQNAPGLVAAARDYLCTVPLRRFGTLSGARFAHQLDTHTDGLRRCFPRHAQSWGVARKLLNIFLRNALYTGYLAEAYDLTLAEGLFEVPLDSIVAKRLRGEVARRSLPPWLGVKHLSPETSTVYQDTARAVAKRYRVAPVHLDALWWGGPRSPAA